MQVFVCISFIRLGSSFCVIARWLKGVGSALLVATIFVVDTGEGARPRHITKLAPDDSFFA